jgi:hypothetical protein
MATVQYNTTQWFQFLSGRKNQEKCHTSEEDKISVFCKPFPFLKTVPLRLQKNRHSLISQKGTGQ